MRDGYAEDFHEILTVLESNEFIRTEVLKLIDEKNVVGKVLEGGDRKQRFKDIMRQLVNGEVNLDDCYLKVEREVPRSNSIHANNNRVFSSNWGERLVRTNLSKYYNQFVLLKVLEDGESEVYIPHSRTESPDSPCSMIAGTNHNAADLLNKLVDAYEENTFSKEIKIPNHPHCTHVVIPTN